MQLFQKKYISLKVNRELWEEVKQEMPTMSNGLILRTIFDTYLESEKNTEKLQKAMKTIVDLENKCEKIEKEKAGISAHEREMQSTVENLEKKLSVIENKYWDVKEKPKVKEIIEGRKEPVIEEKIVHVTDTKTVNALQEKRNELQKKVWEQESQLKQIKKELNEIKNVLERKKLNEHAILVKYNNDEKKFKIEKINLSEFNMYMRDERAFCRSKEIPHNTPYCVVQVWTDVF